MYSLCRGVLLQFDGLSTFHVVSLRMRVVDRWSGWEVVAIFWLLKHLLFKQSVLLNKIVSMYKDFMES